VTPAGLSAISYALPRERVTVEELEARGLIESGAARLRSLGFAHAYLSDEPAETLAAGAVEQLLKANDVDPESIQALFYAGAIPLSHQARGSGGFLDAFCYPAAKLQYELGLTHAEVIGVGQAGCLGLIRAIDLARDWLSARPEARRVLAVSADVLPSGSPREILYNVISDGACAALVERDAPRNRILVSRHTTKGYYWDPEARKAEIIAAYFPTARHVVLEAIAAAGLVTSDIDHIIPQNVSARSWEILLDLLDLPRARIYDTNIAAKGHVIAGDPLINLHDAQAEGRLVAGERLILFTFGFGANWGCMVLEH
jgi:3-oxoacyl-[acyl-carrier-protein] synthase-3